MSQADQVNTTSRRTLLAGAPSAVAKASPTAVRAAVSTTCPQSAHLACRVFKAAPYRLGEDWIELVYAAEDLSNHSFDCDDVRCKRLSASLQSAG
jgi:hypothetical protein